jgi:glutathione S-transferase
MRLYDYAAINPLRETPVLELDPGERIAQSSAILWYLAEGTPFLPLDAVGRAQVVSWLSFEQDRVRALPGFVDDFVSYPPNARRGAGVSIY